MPCLLYTSEIEQLIQKEVARAVFQERLRVQREKQRQEALVREQKKQYSRLGFCFTAFFGITLAVQVGAVGIFTLFAPELVKTLQQRCVEETVSGKYNLYHRV